MDQLPKEVVLENALAVLAKPIGREVGEMKAAAAIVDQARLDAIDEHARIKAECDAQVLDMLAHGDEAGARSLAQRELAARERVKQFETAIQEVNRRQLEAKRAAELAEAREKIDAARPLMAERLAEAQRLEKLVREAGNAWARVEALGFQIMHHLPAGRLDDKDFLDRGDIERRVENSLRTAAGHYSEGPSDIANACRLGHSQLMAAHLPRAMLVRKAKAVIGGQEVEVEIPTLVS